MSLRALLIAPLAFTFVNGCAPSSQNPRHDKFFIVVVGDGVETTLAVPGVKPPAAENTTPNIEQGRAMHRGVLAAAKLNQFKGLSSLVTLHSIDDFGDPVNASLIAGALSHRPEVIAVIGHGTSSTTHAAIPAYCGVGIPLIMPIATNPKVAIADDTKRTFTNCFRLPLDDTAQAKAVGLFAIHNLKKRRLCVIYDSSKEAGTYSVFLAHEIGKYVRPTDFCRFDLENHSLADLRSHVKAAMNRFDAIVYCGYANKVNGVIEEFRNVYSASAEPNRPPLILTDSCKVPILNTSGFKAYVCFPCPPLDELDTPDKVRDLRQAMHVERDDESYHVLGYDALLLLSEVITELTARNLPISRASIIDALRSGDYPLRGLGQTPYHFSHVNSVSSYYIFEASTDQATKATFKLARKYTSDDLAAELPK
ncbi:MAG: ABC transporter substrate-binding protein [Gemmataceae bacterium]